MAVAVGDYVQVRRKLGPHIPRGTRGTIVRSKDDLFRVTSYAGPTFWAAGDDLIRLVKGAV